MIRCVALDFDLTLARFVGGFAGLVAIMTRRGVSESIANGALDEANRTCFTIHRYLERVRAHGYALSGEDAAIRAEFAGWVRDEFRVYDDAAILLPQWKAARVPIAIVTFGDPYYQAQKVVATGVCHDDLRPVTGFRGKAPAIRELLARYGAPILFADNKAEELDAIRDAGVTEQEVETVRLADPWRVLAS